MTSSNSTNRFAEKTALVTGANSGLGYEAAAQLAEAGYRRVILACRTLAKAEGAKQTLAVRVGSDPFETLEVDVSSIASAQAASDELIRRGNPIDALLLNAGMVSGESVNKSADGLELSFASSIIGHHVMTVRLLEADLMAENARIVIAGSEAARNDLPAMMGMQLYDFVTDTPVDFGNNLHNAMTSFAKVSKPDLFVGTRYYATTKVFTSWWTAAVARKYGNRVSVFTVSPGSNMDTNAGRHTTGFKKFLFTKVMPALGPSLGMSQPVPLGAKRYVDVLDGNGEFVNGKSYMSKPKKLVGPMVETKNVHLLDTQRQEVAWDVLGELTGVVAETAV
ncbi:MAG: SDR family NAD(P)-dependent oxidoreductase [Chloroflexi bacterium]|nr:SDR family NAD(P)-dependent oxidoreductase [Chloroflexota bacterium]